MMDETGTFARWRLRLSELDFEVDHWFGVKHQASDELFQLLKTSAYESPLVDDVPGLTITNAQGEAKVPRPRQTFGIV